MLLCPSTLVGHDKCPSPVCTVDYNDLIYTMTEGGRWLDGDINLATIIIKLASIFSKVSFAASNSRFNHNLLFLLDLKSCIVCIKLFCLQVQVYEQKKLGH